MTDNPTPIIDRVLEHMAVVVHKDADGREYGMPYSRILELVLDEYPDANTSRKTLATYAQYVKQGRYAAKLARMQLTIPRHRLPSPPGAPAPVVEGVAEQAKLDGVEPEEKPKPKRRRERRAA